MPNNKHKTKGGRVEKSLSRKQRRKLVRTAKKQRNALHHLRKQTDQDLVTVHSPSSPAPSKDQRPTSLKPKKHNKNPEGKSVGGSLTSLHRKQALEISNKREDLEISRLEKLLKIKRRKKLPASFKDEGLDYILDLTDNTGNFDWEGLSSDSELEHTDGRCEDNSDLEERPQKKRNRYSSDGCPPQVAEVTRQVREVTKSVRFDISESDDCVSSDGCMESSDGDEGEEDECEGVPCEDVPGEGVPGEDVPCEGVPGEDVPGEGVPGEGGEKYVPPHLRARGGTKEGENVVRLKKQVQGLVNRLSESNMKSISTQLEQLYRENSRNDMNAAVSSVLLKLCSSSARLTERFAMEHAMLVAILHCNIGQEVGAFLVQSFAQRLNHLLQESPHSYSTKELSCVIMILAFLYNYRVIHCVLVYDIIRRLLEALSERNIELLLILLKNTGMEIRKDDATSLREIILLIQQKAASNESTLAQSSRVKFMLDTISALKTNNARKIPNFDPSLLEHMKRLLRGIVGTSSSLEEGQLKISLQDLLNADSHGRWWIVGSAWTGRDPPSQTTPTQSETWVLDLAKRQRMTTDVRKNIFSVIMTSEDYADAFEKLVKLSLKDVQEREMIHVLVDCCLQENTFNPYYAFLGQKLCEFKRNHQVTFQYSLWDRFKVLESLSRPNRTNLIKLISHLMSSKALSMAVLRIVEFADLSPTGVRFFKDLLRALLCDHPEETVRGVFVRIAPLPHLKALRDKLLIFIKHYLVREKESLLLNERFKIVEKSMRTDGHLF